MWKSGMGNELDRAGRFDDDNATWKNREPHNKQFEALAMVLTRTPSYLGLVALNLDKARVKEISTSCTKAYAKVNNEYTGEQQKQIQVLTKYVLLLEWKKDSTAPTSGLLEQQLWQAGYDSPAYEEILKKRWSLESLQRKNTKQGENTDRSLLFSYLQVEHKQMGNLLQQLKLQTKPANSCSADMKKQDVNFLTTKCENSTKDNVTWPIPAGNTATKVKAYRSQIKTKEFIYVEVADVSTQTVFECVEI